MGDSPGPPISLWCSAHGTVPRPFRSPEGSHGGREKSSCPAAMGHESGRPASCALSLAGDVPTTAFMTELLPRIQAALAKRYAIQRELGHGDRKSVVQGKSVDLGGRRIIKKKKKIL